MFKSLFKPKWQSTKPQTRIQALQGLDITNKNDRNTIELMAKRDLDNEVRLAAIKRLNKRNTVLDLIKSERDQDVCQGAIDHLLSLVSVRAAGTDSKFIDILKELGPQVLAQFIEKTTDVELGRFAIKSIEDEVLLEQFAVGLSMTQLRQTAANMLHSEPVLERAIKHSKGKDKSVWRTCKEKLQVLREKQQEEATIEQQIHNLCQSLEALSRLPFDGLYEAKMEHLQKQWHRQQLHADQEANQRFTRAFSLCRATVDEVNNEQDRLAEENQQKRDAIQERMAACDLLEDAVKQFGENVELKQEDIPALKGLLSTQKVRWDEAAATNEPAPDERKRFLRIFNLLQSALDATRQLVEREASIGEEATRLLGLKDVSSVRIQKQRKNLDRALGGLQWPESFVEPGVLSLYRKAIAHSDKMLKEAKMLEQQAVDNVKVKFSDLKQEIEAGHLKLASKLLKDAGNLVKHLPVKTASGYQKKLRELTSKVNELRDWQGFVSTPKKEELCVEMESLVDVNMDTQALSNKIRRLQHEWRELGEADKGRNKELWDRFSRAADKAYEPCKVYFEKLSEIRNSNLEKRIQICEQMSVYLERYDWENADWKAVSEVYEAAKNEWRIYTPVERKEGKKVQDRFNGLLDQLRNRLYGEFDHNKTLREKLIESVEALIELDDLSAAIEKTKKLQQEWRTIGMVSRRDDNRLWRQFRGACDKVFKRREEQRDESKKNREQNQVNAEHICEQIEQLAEGDLSHVQDAKQEYNQLKQRFHDVGDLPREDQGKLKERFQVVSKLFLQGMKRAQSVQDSKVIEFMWHRAMLCEQLEEKVLYGRGEESLDDFIASIEKEWQSNSLLPDDMVKPLRHRFDASIQALRSETQIDDRVLSKNCEHLHELCIRLEIAVGVYSPEEDNSRRMALQVSRLSDGLSQRGESLDGNALIEQLQKEWCAIDFVDHNQRTVLHSRFQSVIQHLHD